MPCRGRNAKVAPSDARSGRAVPSISRAQSQAPRIRIAEAQAPVCLAHPPDLPPVQQGHEVGHRRRAASTIALISGLAIGGGATAGAVSAAGSPGADKVTPRLASTRRTRPRLAPGLPRSTSLIQSRLTPARRPGCADPGRRRDGAPGSARRYRGGCGVAWYRLHGVMQAIAGIVLCKRSLTWCNASDRLHGRPATATVVVPRSALPALPRHACRPTGFPGVTHPGGRCPHPARSAPPSRRRNGCRSPGPGFPPAG